MIPTTLSVRNAKTTMMLHAYDNEDAIAHPLLDKQKIPLTFALLLDSFPHIESLFGHCPPLVFAVKAAFCLGYAASLRPSEYLHTTGRIVPDSKQVMSSTSYFWFNDAPYCVCDPTQYPTGEQPDLFSSILLQRKNDKKAKGSPLAIANPTVDTNNINCLLELFKYLQAHPPLPHTPLLSGCPVHITTTSHIKPILEALTHQHKFPPNKLMAHSSIRSAVLSQINDQSDEVKQRQGGWTSKAGMMIYTRPSFQHAINIANDIHDPTKVPTTHLQHIFGSIR